MPEKSDLILFALIRKAIDDNCQVDDGLFVEVDWPDVIAKSMAFGTGAIVCDGIEKLPAECRPDRKTWIGSLGQVMKQENLFEHNWVVAQKLAGLWGTEGINAVVLKGRAIAQYYPKPKHRYSCDLDVFIPDESREPKAMSDWERACRLLVDKGVNLEYEVYKEVEFTLNGAYVECHRYITPVRGNKHLQNVERYLRSLLVGNEASFFADCNLINPPLMFSVMLYVEHALWDLLHGKLTLKHIVDWMVLRKQPVDWAEFEARNKEFKFDRFVSLINALADVVEGKRTWNTLPASYQEVLTGILQPLKANKGHQSWFRKRVDLFFDIIKSRKQYARFGYCSMSSFLFHAVWSHFFQKEVDAIVPIRNSESQA